jgi:hypothetical protein|tara:strand:+ start:3247 stop:3522 length:276 start_codon:yes stop_codon:yes gene_type:complete
VTGNDDVTSDKVVRQFKDRIANLNGILAGSDWRPGSCAEPWTSHTQKTDLSCAADRRFLIKVVTETFSVARSNLIDQLKGKIKLCRRYCKA